MTEAILAGKDIKKFSFYQAFAIFGAIDTKFSCLSEYFFFGNRPGNARHRNGQYKEVINV